MTRQFNNLLALFDNWDMYERALDNSKNSLGALQKQQDIFLEGTQGKLQVLTATTEELYASLFGSSDVDFFVEFFTKLVEQINNFVKALGGGKEVLQAFSVLLLQVFSTNISQSLGTTINNFLLMSENAKKINAQLEIMKTFKGLNISDADLNRLVQMKEQVLSYGKLVSEEEKNQADEIIRTTAELQNQKQAWEESAKAVQNYFKKATGVTLNVAAMTPKQVQQYRGEAKNIITETQGNTEENNRIRRDIANIQRFGKVEANVNNLENQEKQLRQAPTPDMAKIVAVSQARQNALNELAPLEEKAKDSYKELTDRLEACAEGIRNLNKYGIAEKDVLKESTQAVRDYEEALTKTQQVQVQVKKPSPKDSDPNWNNYNKKTQRQMMQHWGLNPYETRTVNQTVQKTNDEIKEELKDPSSKISQAAEKMTTQGNKLIEQTVARSRQASAELQRLAGVSIEQINAQLGTMSSAWDLFVQKLDVQALVQRFVSVATVMGQIGMSISQISNTWNILTSSDTSFGEKVVSILTTIGMTIPMIVRSVQQLNEAFAATGLITGIVENLKNANIGYVASQIAANEAVNAQATSVEAAIVALRQKAIAENTDVLSLQKGVALRTIKNAVVAEEGTYTVGTTGAIYEQIQAREIDNVVTTKSIALHEALKASMLSNPIVMFAAGIAALVGAFALWNKHLDEVNEKQIENNKSLEEAAQKTRDLHDSLTELHDAYLIALDDYKEAGEDKQNLIDATAELCEALDIENYKVDLLSENYDKLNNSISAAMATQAEKALETESKNIEGAAENVVRSNDEFYRFRKGDTKLTTAGLTLGGNSYFNTEIESQISKILEKRINKADLSNVKMEGFNQGTELGSFNLYGEGLLDADNIKKIYNAINKTLEILSDSFSPEELNESKLYGNLVDYTKAVSDEIETIDESLNSIYDEMMELAVANMNKDATGSRKKDMITAEDVVDVETYLQYREQIREYLELVAKEVEETTGEHFGAKKINDMMDDLLRSDTTPDNVKEQADKYDLRTETESRLKAANREDTWKEIEAFLDELENSGKLELALTFASPDEAIEKFKKEVTEGLNEANAAIAQKTNEIMVEDIMQQVQTKDITYKNAEDTEEWTDMRDKLDQLKEAYPEIEGAVDILNKTWLIGTQDYLEALEFVQDALNNLTTKNLVKGAEDASDEVEKIFDEITKVKKDGTLTIKANADLEEFEDALDALMNANYEIDIQLHTEAEQEFDSINNAFDDIYEKAGLIGEGFVVAADKVRELNNTFPGIVDGLEVVGDGTVRLNKEIVNSAISAAEAEVQADAQATIDKLQNQEMMLRAKQATYQQLADAAYTMAKGEEATEKEKSDALGSIDAGLADLRQENAQIVAQSELDNNQLIADSSQINAKADFDSWSESDMKKTKSNAEWARTAIQNMQEMLKGPDADISAISEGQFDTNYQGATGTSIEAALIKETRKKTKDDSTSTDEWQRIADQWQSLARSAGATANDVHGMIAQTGARGIEIDKGFENVKAGKGIEPKEEKTKDPKDPDLMDYLEDEKDIYHDINIQLEKLSHNLEKVQSQQSKMYGKDLIKNLNQQLKILEKTNEAYKTKLTIAQGEKKDLKSSLKSQGVTFNSDGTIANYNVILDQKRGQVNNVIASYNAMTAEEQEAFKPVVEAEKKAYETIKDNMDRYDDLISDEIPELKQNIQDTVDKEIAIKIEKFNMEVEIRLDMGQAERDFLDFKKKVIDRVKDDDILGNAKANLAKYKTYYSLEGDGEIQTLTRQVQGTMNQLQQIDATGTSEWYGDNKAQAMEDLSTHMTELQDKMMELVDLEEEIRDAYLDMIDKTTEAFDKQVENYEYLDEIINHDFELVGLLYGDKAYSEMDSYYRQIHQNNLQEIDFLRQRTEYAKKMMDAETDPEAKEKWTEEWKNSLSSLKEAVTKDVGDIQNIYSNGINQIFQDWERKFTGGGESDLDYEAEKWNLITENADLYLDKINSIYEVQKLQSKYTNALNDIDSLGTQQKLKDLMDQQLSQLKQKEKLTQYDVDRANKLYEIALKEISLQDAQSNKSKMRLRRDAQGNYSYQYVADEDDIAEKMQELQDLRNDLYNFDKEAYSSNLSDMLQATADWKDKMQEISNDLSLSEEERLRRQTELTNIYNERMTTLVEQNEGIKQNLQESTFIALSGEYETNKTAFKEMTEGNTDDFKKMIEENKVSVLGLTGKSLDEFRKIADGEKEMMTNEIVPNWNNNVKDMIGSFQGFGQESQRVLDDIKGKTNEYEGELEILQTTAGMSFDEIKGGYDKAVQATKELIEVNEELIDSHAKEVEAIQNVIKQLDEAIKKYEEFYDAAIKVINAAKEYERQQQAAAAAAAKKATNASSTGKKVVNVAGETNPNDSATLSGSSKKKTESEKNDYKRSDIVQLVYDMGIGKYANAPNRQQLVEKAYPGMYNIAQQMLNEAIYSDRANYDSNGTAWKKTIQSIVKKYGFDTGGYTGDWRSEDGKLAILHQKELVLNKEDTKNMLSAVSIVRDIDGLMNNINSNLVSRVSGLLAGLSNIPTLPVDNTQTVEQKVQIDATFPNVKDSREIENAFNNLVNIASQRAFNNQR